MKIDKDAGTSLRSIVSETIKAKSKRETAEEVDTPDRVQLSRNMLAINVAQRVKQTPSTQLDKVDSIRAAIENDQYTVNVKQTVKAILKDNLLDELL